MVKINKGYLEYLLIHQNNLKMLCLPQNTSLNPLSFSGSHAAIDSNKKSTFCFYNTITEYCSV